MSEMAEKVAAAIIIECDRQASFAGRDGDWAVIDGPLDIIKVARAAIEAVREPSEAMLLAGAGIEPFRVDFIEKAVAKWCWEAMINEALK